MIKTTCLKCSYEWITKSKLITVSCPSCGSKVKIRDSLETKNIVGGVKKEEHKQNGTTRNGLWRNQI